MTVIKRYAPALGFTAAAIFLAMAIVIAFGFIFGRPAAANTDPSSVGSQWSGDRPLYQGAPASHRYAKRHHRRSSSARHRSRVSVSARHHQRVGTGTVGMPAPLASKVAEIEGACGSQLISGHRPGAIVAGSRSKKHPNGTVSNHSRGTAADVQGNPACIYSHLRGWPGGYSTDYSTIGHVHISYDHNHEWGARFVHGGGHSRYARARHHHRYAHHRRHHYAMR